MFLFENSICVFGGTTGWEYNSELFRLDLSGRKWEHIEAKGQEPHGRLSILILILLCHLCYYTIYMRKIMDLCILYINVINPVQNNDFP